jgi:DNA-binding XRE family transcriptional regulator
MKVSQIKAGRMLLRWTQHELAVRARINRRTVANIETGKHTPNLSTVLAIQRAFEAGGLRFVDGEQYQSEQ